MISRPILTVYLLQSVCLHSTENPFFCNPLFMLECHYTNVAKQAFHFVDMSVCIWIRYKDRLEIASSASFLFVSLKLHDYINFIPWSLALSLKLHDYINFIPWSLALCNFFYCMLVKNGYCCNNRLAFEPGWHALLWTNVLTLHKLYL